MAEYIVEMSHITKAFPGVIALDDVQFNLKRGEVLACLGENGAGKSTLMKILAGIYKKDSGTIKVDGQEIDHMTPKRAEKLGIAIIHQELNMCEHLTVAQNIFLGREMCKSGVLSNREMNKATKEELKRLNIDLNPEAKVGDLPVSKQQMVEIVKALAVNSKILIMDEPFKGLDAALKPSIMDMVRAHAPSHTLIITHDPAEAKYMGSKIIKINP